MARYNKGLIRDTFPADQPEGTWRYAKNAVINRVDGTIGNEEGTIGGPTIGRKTKDGVINGYKVIGTIEITDDRIIVFSVSTMPNSADYQRSEIGMLHYTGVSRENFVYKTLLNFSLAEVEGEACIPVDTSLKFTPRYPIHGTYKINAQQDLVVYWTDNYNPPRAFNISRQERAIQEIGDIYVYNHIYGKFPELSANKNYIDRLNLFPHAGPTPSIDLVNVISGGGLLSGTYSLALAYVDKDLVATNYVIVDNPVPIVEDVESVLPIERYDGAPAGTQTGKSIVWRIYDYNTDYDYIRPAIIQHLGEQTFAFELHDLEITIEGPEILLTFSGTEGYKSTSVEDIIIDSVAYDTAKTITQLDDILYLGNLKRETDIGFQPHAGNIVLKPKVRLADPFDEFSMVSDNLQNGFIEIPPFETTKENGYRHPYNSYKRRGYTRGEVYAFYIAFILNDGSMSYAYHIPGREDILDELSNLSGEDDYVSSANLSKLGNVKNFHFKSYSGQPGSNDMEYWENAHEYYPTTDAFDNSAYRNGDGSPKRVRHHRFPKNDNSNYRVINSTSTSEITTEAIPQPVQTFKITGAAVNNQDLSGLNITWNLYNGEVLVGTSASQYDDEHEAYRVDNASGIVPGEYYVIEWEGECAGVVEFLLGTPGGAYLARVLAVSGNWVLVDHSPSSQSGLFGTLGFGANVNLYGNGNQSTDYPNDSYGANLDGICDPMDIGGQFISSQLTGAPEQITEGGEIAENVSILGFTLENIRIPQDIADKVQGFRIYYADRTHEDKRILGQGVVTPYDKVEGKIGGCTLNTDGAAGKTSNFWVKTPLRFRDDLIQLQTVGESKSNYQMLSFYNFELLRTHNSISPATHISTQWAAEFHVHLGPGVHHLEESDNACNVEIINSRFYIAGDYETESVVSRYRLLKERCKTYVNGNSILDASGFGFGYKLYNQGGETHIALGLEDSSGLLPAINDGVDGNEKPQVDADSSYLGLGVKAYTVNLEAFKSDVYNTIDSQDLVWTGFEIKGKNLENFIEGFGGDYAIGSLTGGRKKVPKAKKSKRGKSSRSFNPPAIGQTAFNPGDGTPPQYLHGRVFRHEPETNSYWIISEFDAVNPFYNNITRAGGSGTSIPNDECRVSHKSGTEHPTSVRRGLQGADQQFDYKYYWRPQDIVDVQSNNLTGLQIWHNWDPDGDLATGSITPGYDDWEMPTPEMLKEAFDILDPMDYCGPGLCIEFPNLFYKPRGYRGGSAIGGESIYDVGAVIGADTNDFFTNDRMWSAGDALCTGEDHTYNQATVQFYQTYGNQDYHKHVILTNAYMTIAYHDGSPGPGFPGCPDGTVGAQGDPNNPYGVYLFTADNTGHLRSGSTGISGEINYDAYSPLKTAAESLSGYDEYDYMPYGDCNDTTYGPYYGAFPNTAVAVKGELYGNYLYRKGHIPRWGRVKFVKQIFLAEPEEEIELVEEVEEEVIEEVVVNDCQRVTGGNSNTIILGGDTFICKYGFRQTLQPRISTYPSENQVSVLYSIIESTDNVNFRHEESNSNTYFPGSSMQKVATFDTDGLDYSLDNIYDLTARENIKYNPDYSVVNKIRTAIPLPTLIEAPSIFTTRIQRSLKSDPASLIDNFRTFLAADYKDMAKNRGELWTLSTFNNLLYIHMEDSLFVTKGKQTMEMSDGSEAFIGSGDIFAQAPDELIQTEAGYGGTQSQYSTLVTKYGYFFVDERNKKVFLASDKLTEISSLGMEKWFFNNLSADKDSYNNNAFDTLDHFILGDIGGVVSNFAVTNLQDSPIVGKGFVSAWDEKYQRILLTKRALLYTHKGNSLRRKGAAGLPGGIIYDSDTDTHRLLFLPSVNIITNGTFAVGNELVENTTFEHSNFGELADLPATFFWKKSADMRIGVLNNVAEINYADGGFLYQYFTLEKGVEYSFSFNWKGANGIVVEVVGLDKIFEESDSQSEFLDSKVEFKVPVSGVYEIRIYGFETSESVLYLSSTSLKDSAYSSWDLDTGWEIRNGKATNSGNYSGYISQIVPANLGNSRTLTFTIQDRTKGRLAVFFGTDATQVRTYFENGTYTLTHKWEGNNSNLAFYATQGFDGSIDNIGFKITPEVSYTVTDHNFYLDTRSLVADRVGINSVEIPFTDTVQIVSRRNVPSSSRSIPQVGDIYEGGIIFQVDPSGGDYIVYLTTEEDLGDGSGYRWGCKGRPLSAIGTVPTGPLSQIITNIESVTADLVTQDSFADADEEYTSAAEACASYSDAYTAAGDWSLPNGAVLKKISEVLTSNNSYYADLFVDNSSTNYNKRYWSCDRTPTRSKVIYIVRKYSGTDWNDGTHGDILATNALQSSQGYAQLGFNLFNQSEMFGRFLSQRLVPVFGYTQETDKANWWLNALSLGYVYVNQQPSFDPATANIFDSGQVQANASILYTVQEQGPSALAGLMSAVGLEFQSLDEDFENHATGGLENNTSFTWTIGSSMQNGEASDGSGVGLYATEEVLGSGHRNTRALLDYVQLKYSQIGFSPWNSTNYYQYGTETQGNNTQEEIVNEYGNPVGSELYESIYDIYNNGEFADSTWDYQGWNLIHNTLNHGSPLRHLLQGNVRLTSDENDWTFVGGVPHWYIPSIDEAAYIAKNCTIFPDKYGNPQGDSTFISSENIPFIVGSTEQNLFVANESIPDTPGGGSSGAGRSVFPTAIILGSSTIIDGGIILNGSNTRSNKAFLGIHLNRTHQVDSDPGEIAEQGGGHRSVDNPAYIRRTLQADDAYDNVDANNPDAAAYYASAFPAGLPDQQVLENEPQLSMYGFESGEEFYRRRYVFHQVAKINTLHPGFGGTGNNDLDNVHNYDVGDEFDINPHTGDISAATGGRNTVQVFLIEERGLDNEHVRWIGNRGSAISDTDSVEKAFAVDASTETEEVISVDVQLGVRPIRKTLYTIPEDPIEEEEEVVEEVIDNTPDNDNPVDSTPIEDPTEDTTPIENTDVITDNIIDTVGLGDPIPTGNDKVSNVIWQRVGWTISYYPELKAWGSFHDYIPHHYTYSSKTFYSFFNWEEFPKAFWISNNQHSVQNVADDSWTIWEHNRMEAPGEFYSRRFTGSIVENTRFIRPFEIEIVHNAERDMSKIFSSFSYETEVYKPVSHNYAGGTFELNQMQFKRLDKDGFSHFFVYNNTQHSGVTPIKYLENVRKVGHLWNINKFRDMANLYTTTFPGAPAAYAPNGTLTSGSPYTGSILPLVTLESNSNVADPTDSLVDFVGNHDVHDMFEATWGINGIYTIFTNSYYIDNTKSWETKRKFNDTYLGIRLIHDNLNRNFVNLYSTFVGMRKNKR